VTLEASAEDSDGTITRVDFLDGTTLLGSDSTPPYSVSIELWLVGAHTLTAMAVDEGEATTTSAEVTVVVEEDPEAPATVNITDDTFEPVSLTIDAGETVTWINRSTEIHTVTSGAAGQYDGVFNSGPLTNGTTFTFRFNQEGTYAYFCLAHGSFETGGSQRGTIIVLPSETPVAPGNLLIARPVDGAYALRLSGIPGQSYQVEYTEDLGQGRWVALGNLIADASGQAELIDRPTASSTHRFYRAIRP
jgi:plastocyanin